MSNYVKQLEERCEQLQKQLAEAEKIIEQRDHNPLNTLRSKLTTNELEVNHIQGSVYKILSNNYLSQRQSMQLTISIMDNIFGIHDTRYDCMI